MAARRSGSGYGGTGRGGTGTTRRAAPENRPFVELLVGAVGGRALDVATGPRVVASEAARAVGPTGSALATDLVPEWGRPSRRSTREGLANVAVAAMGAEVMALPSAPFKAALRRCALTFVPDPVRALREMRRVPSRSGRLGGALRFPGARPAPHGSLREHQRSIGDWAPGRRIASPSADPHRTRSDAARGTTRSTTTATNRRLPPPAGGRASRSSPSMSAAGTRSRGTPCCASGRTFSPVGAPRGARAGVHPPSVLGRRGQRG